MQAAPFTATLTVGNKTFSPLFEDKGIWTYQEDGANSDMEAIKLTIQTVRTATGNRKVSCRFRIPVVSVETIGGVAVRTLLRVEHNEVRFTSSEDSSPAERKTSRELSLALVGSAILVATVDSNEGIF